MDLTDSTEEIWKVIPKYNNYSVSNIGNVKNTKFNKPMNPSTNKAGYMYITLRLNGVAKGFFVHRLVAAAFIPNPHKLPTVDHIDRYRENNTTNNLRWASYKDQARNRGPPIYNIQARRSVWKCSVETGERLELFESTTHAIESVNPSKKHLYKMISGVARGHSNSAFGFKWEYADAEVIEGEIWKALDPTIVGKPKGTSLEYHISNHGRLEDSYGHIRVPYIGNKGYGFFSVYGSVLSAHRLVASSFLDKVPGKDIVNHINGDRSDCSVSNLEWVTLKENAQHAIVTGLSKSYKINQYDLDGNFIKQHQHTRSAAEELNLNKDSIRKMLYNGHTLGGFQWRLAENNQIPVTAVDDSKYKFYISQYDLAGRFIRDFKTQAEAAKECGVDYPSIKRATMGNRRSCKGFQFRRRNSEIPVENLTNKIKTKGGAIKVQQCNLDGSIITEFKSLTEASRETGYHRHHISETFLTGKPYKGYKWVRSDSEESRKRKREE